MEILFDFEDEFYSDEEKKLKNAVTVIDGNKRYHYAFERIKDSAIIRYDDITYIDEAAEFFKNHNLYINKIKSNDNEYYREFDYIYSFKLPLDVIQPTDMFLDEEKYNYLKEIDIDPENIYLPVRIIDDHYVLLNGITFLKIMKENYERLVNVYINDDVYVSDDLLYVLREKNIIKIDDVDIIEHNVYSGYIKLIEELKKEG